VNTRDQCRRLSITHKEAMVARLSRDCRGRLDDRKRGETGGDDGIEGESM
jgi:hypothetical protein